jgi:hypothetical protein
MPLFELSTQNSFIAENMGRTYGFWYLIYVRDWAFLILSTLIPMVIVNVLSKVIPTFIANVLTNVNPNVILAVTKGPIEYQTVITLFLTIFLITTKYHLYIEA